MLGTILDTGNTAMKGKSICSYRLYIKVDEESNNKYQWHQKLVLWGDKQNG